jgi:hypothetical protein
MKYMAKHVCETASDTLATQDTENIPLRASHSVTWYDVERAGLEPN